MVAGATAACSSASNQGAGGADSGGGSSGGGRHGGGSSSGGTGSGSGGGTGVTASDDGSTSTSSDDGGSAAVSSDDGEDGLAVQPAMGASSRMARRTPTASTTWAPVDYAESAVAQARARPVRSTTREVQKVEGTLLAGLWNGIANTPTASATRASGGHHRQGQVGDASRRHVRRHDQRASIDTSPEAYTALNTVSENPRSMTCRPVRRSAPTRGPMMYEFQTGSSQYWTSRCRSATRAFRLRRSRSRARTTPPGRRSHAAPATGRPPTRAGSAWASSSIRSTGMDRSAGGRYVRLAERRRRRRVP